MFLCYFQHIGAPVPAFPVTPIPGAVGIVRSPTGCQPVGSSAALLLVSNCPCFIWGDISVSTRAAFISERSGCFNKLLCQAAGCLHLCFNLLLVTRDMWVFGRWETIRGAGMFWAGCPGSDPSLDPLMEIWGHATEVSKAEGISEVNG